MPQHCQAQYSNAGNTLLGVFAIATVRDYIEVAFKGNAFMDPAEPLKTIKMFFLHFNSFYFLVYVCLSLILYLFARKRVCISECFKMGAMAMMLIWLAPVFDYFTSREFNIYYPPNPMDVIYNLHHFVDINYHYEGLSLGMRIEIILAGFCGTGYLFYRTHKSIPSVLGGLMISFACLAIGLFVPLITQLYEYGWNFGKHELYNSILLHQGFVIHGAGCKIASLYLFLCIVLFSVAYYIRNPKYFYSIVGNFRWTRTIHYLLLFGAGLLYTYHHPPILGSTYDGEFEYLKTIWNHPTDLFGIFMAFLAIILSFQSAVICNDIYDYDIDIVSNTNRPLVTKAIPLSEYKLIGKMFAILSLSIAFCINETFFLFVLLYQLLAFLYSVQPFRLRSFFIVSNIELAIIFILTFHAGATVLIPDYRFDNIPTYITFGLLICYAFALSIKDFKDYEGDKLLHIQTIYTLFGKKYGSIICVLLVCCSIILTPVLLHLTQLIPYSIIICILFIISLSFIHYHRIKEMLVVILYYIYLIVLFYVLIIE